LLRSSLAVPAALAALLALFPAASFAGPFRFTTIDIGQGDGAVVVAPSGCAALLDGGPTGAGAKIKSYLRSIGVTQVDFAILSHFHADHLGGLDEVEQGADGIPIGTVYDRGGSYSSTAYSQYASQFAGRRQTAALGQVIDLCGEVQLRVVAVNANGLSTTDENARSLVVKISWGELDALVGGDLTGDTGKDVESLIEDSVGLVELYKVHHHGSRYSSNAGFVNAILPRVSFVSVGWDNPYGHPTAEAMARIAGTGSAIWQTEDPGTQQELGDIELTSDDGLTFTVSQGGSWASYSSHPPADSEPPGAPSDLGATAVSTGEIDLGWTASADNVGVTGYRVYRSTDGGNFSLVGTSSTTGLADVGLSASTTYWYFVTAVDAAGNESAASDIASATTFASPGQIILNEVLANEPGSSTAGELVEAVNVGGSPVNISGWTIRVSGVTRHTFASGTTLGPRQAIAVFGSASGIPPGTPGAIGSSTGSLALVNSGATVSVRNPAGTTISSVTYGTSLTSRDGVSMNRNPDASPSGSWVLHDTISALPSSPATDVNGGAF